ncbi:MAG: hypothetical protein SOW08_12585 [Lachnospiraceae bacterium]|nr:hypothetical protein [Lachnospiraceae bacterium]
MENSYRYEAAVLGDGPAALFAGYLLKKNRIRFVILDEVNPGNQISDSVQKLTDDGQKSVQIFEDDISQEGKNFVQDVYRRLAFQVGIHENHLFDPNEEEMARFRTLLAAELQGELRERKKVINIVAQNGFVLLKCADQVLDADVLISQENIIRAGYSAQLIMEKKQAHLEEYMRRLRIRQGKRTLRKMVYVTHSKSWFYAREVVMQFAVKRGVAPVNPFMTYGFYMNGKVERDEVIECCHQLIRTSDELWVFGPVSEAILTDIAVAVMEGKEVHFFSISENASEIRELQLEDIIFEREVHAGQIKKSDLLNFVRCTTPRKLDYVQMSLFD